ncbi:hypothetical protein DYB32_003548 [Aphanomyces invadans]|uniref:Uncharacterized protein n=1 Tax=Aphanomyces invadans TaxID=157072 RepID=A0A3R6VNV0_9STRA|nr:hypothetical protein DYB32_003548 [Aphanomyces invadans]
MCFVGARTGLVFALSSAQLQSPPHPLGIPRASAPSTVAPADVVVDFAIAAPLTTSLDGSTWILHDVLTKYALCLSGSSDVPRLAAAFSTASDMRRNTALHVGLACGHVGFCTALVRDHGVDLFAINVAGDSALDLARRSPDPNLRAVLAPMDVTTLTKATPPPAAWMEKRDARGQSPLVHAALAGHWTGVQWMLQHGADPAPIQALKLPRNVQRAVAASQHAHLVVHHRYVVHTNRVVEIDPSPGDQTCVALDLHTGHSVRLVPFQSKQAQDAYCLQVDSIQRRSPWVCGVLDAFEDDDAFVVVLEGAGHHGDVLDCFQPPEPPLHIAKMLVSAMAALHSGGFVHVCCVSARSAAGDLWTVVYDDGDSEDVTKAELAAILVKKSVKGHVAASDPLAHGQSVWLMHDHQLVGIPRCVRAIKNGTHDRLQVARARVCATPPPDLVPSPRGEHNVVCLRITKRFTGLPPRTRCGRPA